MSLIDSLNLRFDGSFFAPLSHMVGRFSDGFQGCLPLVVRRYLARRHRRLMVSPNDSSAALYLTAGDFKESIGTLDLGGRDPLPVVVGGGSKGLSHQTVLLLPSEEVLTRHVSFPAQVRANLPQVIAVELDRLSPFSAEQVVYDYAVSTGAKGDARIGVDLALCRRDRVDGWVKRLHEAGSAADVVTWEGAWPKANLLPPAERPRRRQPLLDPLKLILVVLLLLVAAVLATPLWQKTQILDALDSEVRKARGQAISVDDLRQELERARQGSTAVLQQKWEQPHMIDLLRELTERIPDDTWIQSFEYRDGEVQVRGESSQATALIGLLEQAPGIEGVSFRSPVTQVARTGKERFNLSFTYLRESPE